SIPLRSTKQKEQIMGLEIRLSVQQQDNVVFSDLDALNSELSDGPRADMFEDYEDEPNFIELAANDCPYDSYKKGDIIFNGRDDNSAASIEVWGWFDDTVRQIIASHLQSGRIVFRLDIEGNSPEWYAVEPGKHSE